MKYILAIALSLPFINGCSESAKAESPVIDPPPVSCDGFGASDINIYVKDSISDEIIDSANVQIHIEDEAKSIINAEYVSGEDSISNTEETAYYALLNVNKSQYEYGIVVSESNYHSSVTKNLPYTLITSCGANNTAITTVYLCQLGSTCL